MVKVVDKFIWQIPDRYPERLIGEYQRDVSPDRFDLQEARFLPKDWGPPQIKFNATCAELKKYDDLANNAMVPLISPRFSEVLAEAAGETVQLIPAVVWTSDGELAGYTLVNVTVLGETIDKNRSEYHTILESDDIRGFSRIVFLDDPDPRFIVREKICDVYIVVSDELKHLCEKHKVRGVGLYRADEMIL